jgi:hypothetical protein
MTLQRKILCEQIDPVLLDKYSFLIQKLEVAKRSKKQKIRDTPLQQYAQRLQERISEGSITEEEIVAQLTEVQTIAQTYFGYGGGDFRLGYALHQKGVEDLAERVLVSLSKDETAGGYAQAAIKLLQEEFFK